MPIVLSLIALSVAQSAATTWTLMPSGLFDKIHGFAPFGVKLTDAKPESLKKAPVAAAPKYGTLKVGHHEYLVMTDGPDKVYVDSNADGDLTNDPAAKWVVKTYKSGGGERQTHEGSATIDFPYEGKTTAVAIGLYETGQPNTLGYYSDFALTGNVTLGGKSYAAVYADPSGTWDGKKGTLMIDKDADGKFHPGYEFYRVTDPFNVGGTTYEMSGAGGKLAFVKSAKTVEERTAATAANMDPNDANGLKPGKAALTFQATTMGGKPVSFPNTYKGKVVMVDFWATWCGPCMREVPNVVKAYGKYHDQGFEVLGVSLDQPDSAEKIKSVTAKNGMTWDQIYDGKFWQAAIAKQYGIQAIPATYLVDGDTGKILATSNTLRGENLDATLAKVLAEKKASASASGRK